MAYIFKRQVSIKWKINPDAFQVINKSVIVDVTRRFGSTTAAVNSILVKRELLESTMPIILGLNPTELGWQKAVANYWNSLAVDIPENGKELEIGFIFDLSDKIRQEYIKPLKDKYKFKTDEEFANTVMSDISEDEKYKYGTPIKAEDYLLWIYSSNYRDVANKPEDIDKSPFIRFFIYDEQIVKKQKQASVNLAMKAQEVLMDVLKANDSKDKIYNILCVLEPANIPELTLMSNDDLRVKIFDTFSRDHNRFIEVSNDSNLHTRALIEKLLHKNILRKLPSTDIIVDNEDPSLKLGDTINDTISWFSLEQNEAKVSEYKVRLKA